MGMRSTIAYTDKSGVTKVTSVQWSTQLDYNMSLDFASRKPDAADNARRVGEMFKSITDNYEHISSLDRISEEDREKDGASYDSMGDDTEFCAVGGQPRGRYGTPTGEYTRGPGLSQGERDRFITQYHMDDGIGASYDERDPGKLTYFYADDATGKVIMQEATMGQIRAGTTTKGYHDADSDEAFKKRLTKMKARARKEAAASKAKAAEGVGEKEAAPTVASSTASGSSGGGGGTGGSVHVNPKTGKTGKCRAHKDPCPFGGDSGTDNHYDTVEEARAAYEKSQGGGGLSSLKKG